VKSFFPKGETSERKKKVQSNRSPLLSFCMCFSYVNLLVVLLFLFFSFFIYFFNLYPRWLMCNYFYSLVVVINIFPLFFFCCYSIERIVQLSVFQGIKFWKGHCLQVMTDWTKGACLTWLPDISFECGTVRPEQN